VINVLGLAKIPAGRQLSFIRYMKARLGESAERGGERIVRGESAKDEEEAMNVYRKLLAIVGKDYRDPFNRHW